MLGSPVNHTKIRAHPFSGLVTVQGNLEPKRKEKGTTGLPWLETPVVLFANIL